MLSDTGLAALPRRSRTYGDRAAIICVDRRISYVELDERVSALAALLRRQNIGSGDVVSICGPVGWEWVVCFHAALRVGAITNPINALLTLDEVSYILRDCSSRLLFCEDRQLAHFRASPAISAGVAMIGFGQLDGLYDQDGSVDPVTLAMDGTAAIFYTSGTTGRPKGALISHRALALNAGHTALMHGRSSSDVIVTALPLAHVYGNAVLNSALIVGATLVLVPVFTPEAAFEAIGRNRATRFEGVPTMYYRMLDSPLLATARVDTLVMCTVGGQTMPVDKMRAVEESLSCPLIELWGMSELGGLGTTFPWTGPRILGSIGIPMPGMSVRTVDPVTGDEAGVGQAGELHIRGPLVMNGYLGNVQGTAEVLNRDGWLATGDIARIGDGGEIYILDRMKDVILTSGNNVYPAEIERVISSLPGVIMVGVGRDPHPDKGEVAHAYIVSDPTARLSEQMVIEYCRGLLAPYKLPRAVSFVDDLPKTSSGKIMRRQLGKNSLEIA